MVRTRETVLCLSHLRWDFVFQRPQHLMSRCAQDHQVIFFEEPIFDAIRPDLATHGTESGVTIAVPHLPPNTPAMAAEHLQRMMLDRLLDQLEYVKPVLWYFSPMALAFTHHVRARAVVYDCMDELSLFHDAPVQLVKREALLLRHADLVFTGGQSLYEHKRVTSGHHNIHAFPSSVDVPHFARAREGIDEPADQAAIPHPRVGYFGVIDERMDLELITELADLRPDLQLVMIGPVVKIDPAILPQRANIHWLGSRRYDQLPSYLSGWDVAMMPFARNDSTRFISPTKTPEYLAAGKPVVSTSIADVVVPYGRGGYAWIADTASEMSFAIDRALASDPAARMRHADAFLAGMSWDRTWKRMWGHVDQAIQTRVALRTTNDGIGRTGAGSAAQPTLVRRGKED